MRRAFMFFISGLLLISLSGCVTISKEKDLENQKLRNQIALLDTQLQNKDAEINNLRDALTKANTDKEALEKKSSGNKGFIECKSRPSIKQIQTALANAGYNPGSIDGKMGKQTKDAIKAFQKANNLTADGKVGKQTWMLLKSYSEAKTK